MKHQRIARFSMAWMAAGLLLCSCDECEVHDINDNNGALNCEDNNLSWCNNLCIDSMTSNNYCGADSACENYIKCSAGEKCMQGSCFACITFVDAEFEKYALSHWDTHKNGCIDKTEADNASSLEEKAFYQNSGIKSVEDLNHFPQIKSIPKEAFSETDITEVNLKYITEIGESAFAYCGVLTSVEFPKVISIGYAAFYNCGALTSAKFPKVTSLGDLAFYYCGALTSVEFSEVTSIGAAAFDHCSALTSAKFPKVTSIGRMAFGFCTALTNVEFPEAISMGSLAFEFCSALNHLQLNAVDNIALSEYGFGNFYTSNACTLILHPNKKEGGTGTPSASGNTWGGKTWKEIQYRE